MLGGELHAREPVFVRSGSRRFPGVHMPASVNPANPSPSSNLRNPANGPAAAAPEAAPDAGERKRQEIQTAFFRHLQLSLAKDKYSATPYDKYLALSYA